MKFAHRQGKRRNDDCPGFRHLDFRTSFWRDSALGFGPGFPFRSDCHLRGDRHRGINHPHDEVRVAPTDLASALESYLSEAKNVVLQGNFPAICRDPKDDMLFECAVLANAELIVSGDKDVLQVGEYKGIRAITARQYLSPHGSR